uniref:Oxysterol-binding protein n=1 Tax=Daphnia magna TaxID=35525 RepID=A0A0N8E5Y3_9CRUS
MAGIIEGPLSKWTNVVKGWQYRWFVLDDNATLFSYYTSKEKMTRGVRRGCIRLKGAIVGIDDEDDTTFTVTVDMKVFHLQAKDAEEREKWIRGLEDTILRHAQLQRRLDPNHPTPTMQDFDKKLTETDSYLQILIDQVKALELRITQGNDDQEKMRLCSIRDRANEMLESIKHTIVLLQIAKNTTHPVNGVQVAAPISFFQSSPSESLKITNNQQPKINLTNEVVSVIASMEDVPVQTGIELGAECVELRGVNIECTDSVRQSPANSLEQPGFYSQRPLALEIPETSYSSSDDEDFFDASENMGQSPTLPTPSTKTLDELESSQRNQSSVSIDYDALYEDSDEDDLGSMESHGSVVTHLLSQVKLGMDLTKVVLPTFILERRSLLEMYADFFAHPDIFVGIADFTEPRDRIVQVVRWFLSAFHAGRRSEVAKKPYNPIIGETFRCWWDVNKEKPATESIVTDGPVPWCDVNQLTFVAEQVSHHPPVSAFYAEHYGKRISFCAHIWTKSKFLGLSIGVHHIGQGCVSLLDYDEEYIITFPNAYGRSILTVPWVELGGSVSITCAKTGYSASVEFLTKPFYGGKKNRVTAEILQPDRKPFVAISGEWNGAMIAKWADGKTEEFVNVNAMPIVQKRVRPVAEQEEFESRRLWREVTLGLKFNDIDLATKSKSSLEHRQREEARIRKEANEKWETKLFSLVGDNWIYDKPLVKRLAASGAQH